MSQATSLRGASRRALQWLSTTFLAAVCLGLCVSAQAATLYRDLPYVDGGVAAQQLDVCVPDGPGPFPVVVLVHGGGWGSGDKKGAEKPGSGADITPWFAPLTEAGFLWVSINYRLAPENPWPACLDDTQAAVAWVRRSIAAYRGDPERLALMGHSAGGHIALMASLSCDGVRGVVGCAAVSDLVADTVRRGAPSVSLQKLFGLAPVLDEATRQRLAETSPLNHLRAGGPPVLLLHGDADKTVTLDQSQSYLARCRELGVPAELFLLPGAPHRLTEWDNFEPRWKEALITWLRATLAPRERSTAWDADLDSRTYRNPVLHLDYSDPDAIRVGDDYWMTASSFSHVPGLPILHSRDLVHWSLVNHALPRLVPESEFAQPRHGKGVWAPALRHHAGRYWLFYPDPDFGLYVISAEDPRGAWTAPVLLRAGKGMIDPCPFWDEDGRAWLVHAWAASRGVKANRLSLVEMAPDCSRLLDEGDVVVDGDALKGWRTLEGPKLYKRDGWYYIFAPAGGVTNGYQAVFRSKSLRGPYENRIVLQQGSTKINGPHQGAWVDTPSGEHWFLHFQDLGIHGRVVHLQPIRWLADGWPAMGITPADGGVGEPVSTFERPALPIWNDLPIPTSDPFPGGRPGPQWQWQANPAPDFVETPASAARDGLRLRAVPTSENLAEAANLLLQKLPAPRFSAEVRLELDADALEGTRAGLVVYGFTYGWVGLRRQGSGVELVFVTRPKAHEGGEQSVNVLASWPTPPPLRLCAEFAGEDECRLSWAPDAESEFQPAGSFTATRSRWVGAKVGVFCGGPAGVPARGGAKFTDFRVSTTTK